jgi:hypothetical protein
MIELILPKSCLEQIWKKQMLLQSIEEKLTEILHRIQHELNSKTLYSIRSSWIQHPILHLSESNKWDFSNGKISAEQSSWGSIFLLKCNRLKWIEKIKQNDI